MNLARPVATRVTRGNLNRHPIWSPDGIRILSTFQGGGLATFDLRSTSVTSGDVETLRQNDNKTGMIRPMGWTKDGRIVWTEGLEGPPCGRDPRMGRRPSSCGTAPAISRRECLRTAAGSPTPRTARVDSRSKCGASRCRASAILCHVDGGGYPRWRADGRELYFLSPDARLMAATFTPGTPPDRAARTALRGPADRAPGSRQFCRLRIRRHAGRLTILVNRMVSPPETSMSIIVGWTPPR